MQVDPGLIVLFIASLSCSIYLSIYISHNSREASAQLATIPDIDQQIQTGGEAGVSQDEVEEDESKDSFPALESSFAGVISINTLAQNVNYSHFMPLSNSPSEMLV